MGIAAGLIGARAGEDLVWHWSVAEPLSGRQLQQRGRQRALGCDVQRRGGAKLGPVLREQAQELHGLGAEPAANLDADNDEALTAQPGSTSARGWASPNRLGRMPERETGRDNLDAPCIGYRHIDVHVCEPDVEGDPSAGLPRDACNSMLEGQGGLGIALAAAGLRALRKKPASLPC